MIIKLWDLMLAVGIGTVLNVGFKLFRAWKNKGRQEFQVSLQDNAIAELRAGLAAITKCQSESLAHMSDIWEKRFDNRSVYVDNNFVKLDKLNDLIRPIVAEIAEIRNQKLGERMAEHTVMLTNINNVMLELVKASQQLNAKLIEAIAKIIK